MRLFKMKFKHLQALMIATFFISCQSDTAGSKDPATDSTHSTQVSSTDSSILVIPGKSIGTISIKQDMQLVSQALGEPDAGDAAMGKAWGIWYDTDSADQQRTEMAIYSSYKDSSMTSHDVKQIRTTAKRFKTEAGLGVGSTYADFKNAYPDLALEAQYSNQSSPDTIKVYDSKQKGISVEFIGNTSTAITVHEIGKAANETYFTYNPDLKKIVP